MPHFFSGAWKSPPKCFPTRHGLPLSLFYLSFIVVLSISNLNYVSLPKKGDLNLSISLLSARGRPATSSFCLFRWFSFRRGFIRFEFEEFTKAASQALNLKLVDTVSLSPVRPDGHLSKTKIL